MIDIATRRLVRQRAVDRCEYCRLPQDAVDASFHVEHIVARQHHGTDDADNLALACNRCNLTKGPNLSAFDPVTATIVPLYHPRLDRWMNHFEIRGARIEGTTPVGRATVELLQFNASHRLHLRSLLLAAGEF